MKIKHLLVIAFLALVLASCQAPRLGYFQDVQPGEVKTLDNSHFIRIQPGDKMSILVSSKDPQLAYLYNLNIVGHYSSSSTDKSSLSTSNIASYTVDEQGNIDFPVVGKLHIAGMTRGEVAKFIKTTLVNGNYIKDPTVTVDFQDLFFSVIGEVKNPGRFNLDRDQVTIIDAISRAGDLTIYGRRDNVLVLREENGKQISYRLNLSNGKELYESPAFYLKQNDVIYVEPNAMRARESTGTGNAFLQPSLWISLASLITTVIVLITK